MDNTVLVTERKKPSFVFVFTRKNKLVNYIHLFKYIYELEYWLHKARKRVQPIRTGKNINI